MLVGIGDVHGHYDAMTRLLRGAGVLDDAGDWCGGATTLLFMGDFVDRGPRAADAVALAMRLQAQASHAGGRVLSVMGNHDLLLVLVARYGDTRRGEVLRREWERNGGLPTDLIELSRERLDWLAAQPAMLHVDDLLIAHADSTLYFDYGKTVDEVNNHWRGLLDGGNLGALMDLNEEFSEHQAFWSNHDKARKFLKRYGGTQLWHGHTPIHKVVGGKAAAVTEPLLYADGLCVNLDGGIYLGGQGFFIKRHSEQGA